MLRVILIPGWMIFFVNGFCQPAMPSLETVTIAVFSDNHQPVEGATIAMLHLHDSLLLKTVLTDASGHGVFADVGTDSFFCFVTCAGFQPLYSQVYRRPAAGAILPLVLQPATGSLKNVVVLSRKALIQKVGGKVLVNVDASPTNTGTTVLEVLEKSPGVTVDKNGTVSLQGKTGVLVMIDDKPTYLQGAELANLLGSISSSHVEQIELMATPPAKYDAAGNTGIINIKTKKNKQQGFNVALTVAPGIGRYPKSNNNMALNYRKGKLNSFLTYSLNYNKGYTYIYALRNYYADSNTAASYLEQPSMLNSHSLNHTVKTGVDYALSAHTTIGVSLSGIFTHRKGNSTTSAAWQNAEGLTDSLIETLSHTQSGLRNGWMNLNLKHAIGKQQEVSVDVDGITYKIGNEQSFSNELQQPGGYKEGTRGHLPATIRILSAKADHTLRLGKKAKLESGYKASHIATDNTADYQYNDGTQWRDDLGKSNHFVYTETIHALYSSFDLKDNRFAWQAGLRYEDTRYEARQLGNALVKDSSFSRHYRNLFPAGSLSFTADSANTFTLTAGRRIRPAGVSKAEPFCVYHQQIHLPARQSLFFTTIQLEHRAGTPVQTMAVHLPFVQPHCKLFFAVVSYRKQRNSHLHRRQCGQDAQPWLVGYGAGIAGKLVVGNGAGGCQLQIPERRCLANLYVNRETTEPEHQ